VELWVVVVGRRGNDFSKLIGGLRYFKGVYVEGFLLGDYVD
jgi:hypothetical protein